jgi:predicted Zn-dependent peptidase
MTDIIERKEQMENVSVAEKAFKIASFNGIDVFRIDAEKFKTSSINFFFLDNLTRDHATKNALLPAVMRRGCEPYPTFRDISMQLEMLYGASFDCGVTKKGERHIIQFYAEFLSREYVPDGTDSFTAVFDLLFSIVTRPVLENNRFREDILAQEKEKLRQLIESRVNDKMQYSVERCLEEVCSGEPFGIYDYGLKEDLEPITSSILSEHYRKVLETFPMQVYLAGNISDDQAEYVKKRLSGLVRRELKPLVSGFTRKKGIQVRQVSETMNITQGKLCLGFRTNVAPDSVEFPALMVYSGILGGGIHSKLFQNVREKASLAYYSYSRLEKFKGLMVVSSGIEFKNREKALEIILQQLEEIRSGNITEQEIEATLKTMETGMKSLGDSQMSIVDFYLSQSVSGTNDNFDDVIRKLKAVTRDEVAAVAAGIELDTVYFLTAPEQQKGPGTEQQKGQEAELPQKDQEQGKETEQ